VRIEFRGVLFFPVTPFGRDGSIDVDVAREHLATGLANGAGGVFSACGTGEFHALSVGESVTMTRLAVEAAAGAVPVVPGAGGPLPHAVELATRAAEAGADALLLLPPSLVSGPASGLLAADPRIIGFKDGTGDIARMQEIVSVVGEVRDDFAFFNGLLTAEASQAAYRGIGVPLYSSAAFAMAPAIARAFYDAYIAEDEERRLRILRDFYFPLIALRDETPGFGVSLVKAGLRLQGVPVGGVRAPLVDPDARQEQQLLRILERGAALAAELA
jgi:5-dehydro-4-deoxyglucarate dehydratase